MTTFDNREHAFENKFVHDAELEFKTTARRNKLLGMWAAKLLGLADQDATDYAKDVVKSDFEEAGEEDVYRKLAHDLGAEISELEIRRQMKTLMKTAHHQIMTEDMHD